MGIIFSALLIFSSYLQAKENKLIGGDYVTKPQQFPATVKFSTGCSGAKVGDRAFLLAAHCVLNQYMGGTLRASFKTGNTFTLSTHYGETVKLTTIEAHPHQSFVRALKDRIENDYLLYGVAFEAYDIALIFVAEETPSIRKAELSFKEVREGDTLFIGGFGCEGALEGIGGRYKSAQTIALSDDEYINEQIGRDVSKAHEFNFLSAGKKYHPKFASICPGDSGGPVYGLDDKIIGINSQYIYKKNSSGIAYANVHTRLDQLKDWFEDIFVSLYWSANETLAYSQYPQK